MMSSGLETSHSDSMTVTLLHDMVALTGCMQQDTGLPAPDVLYAPC